MSSIRVNQPGDGEWVMERCGGTFYPPTDHVLATHDEAGRIRGGFVFAGHLGAAIQVHMAGVSPGWCTRDLLWMTFHYCFVQLGVRKVVALVASSNTLALDQDLRAGFTLEAVVKEVYPDGADLLILTMRKENCRWLRIKPRAYRPVNHYSSVEEAA